ncbi:MAG: hypothetical protein ACLRYY_03670 [Anaerobutyricum soehngenii]
MVEEDPKEHGVRALLNFGHTLGHSIEKLMNFSLDTWRVCRSWFLAGSGYIQPKEDILVNRKTKKSKIFMHILIFRHCQKNLRQKIVVKETRHDKKMEHGKIKFILLDKVGEAAIYQDVTPEEMLTVLERV